MLDESQIDALRAWADEVEAWPTGSHVWGHYAEHTPDGPRICRTENVSACHPGIASLVTGSLADCAAGALGEPVVAFKDKLNYKQPGGAGFSPHQDKVAYPGVERVMSAAVQPRGGIGILPFPVELDLIALRLPARAAAEVPGVIERKNRCPFER